MRKTFLIAVLIVAVAGPALAAGLTIKAVKDPGELPQALAGFVRSGDFLVTDGKYAAVIAASPRTAFSTINYDHPEVMGYILAFVPEGRSRRAEAQVGVPSIRVDGKALPVAASSVRQDGAGIVVRSLCENGEGLLLEILTRYEFAFDTGRINLTAEVRNAGRGEVAGLSFGLGASALQNYNFSPFHSRAFPHLNFRVWQRPDHVLAWFNPNPLETSEKPLPGRLAPGQTHRVAYSLLAGTDLSDVLDALYRTARTRTERVFLEFKNFEGPMEVMVREPATGTVFYRVFLEEPGAQLVLLPGGTFSVRAGFFPATVERTFTTGAESPSRTWTLEAPAFGRVKVVLNDEGGRHVPGKVSFIGLSPTESPHFMPDNPVVTGRAWETFKNSVHPPKEGLEVTLPVGTYLVAASRGPAYTRETRVVEVLGEGNPDLELILEKAVDTKGLVSVDSHMHTRFSDGNMSVPERLRSVVAEGLDVAVSTDHNLVIDYTADLRRLGLDEYVAVITGIEVTARTGSIHYNTFPVALRAGEPRNGAISVADEIPANLFALSRAKDPGTLIHVNHPRSRGLGYFITYELDEEAAASASAPFDMGFDVMEAMNGAKFGEDTMKSIEDWFHFVNRGYPVRIVGVSDSHGIDGSEPGYARTYVLYDGPKGNGLDAEAVVRAMTEGRSFISNGPVVSVRANRRGTLGDIVAAKKGRVDLDVKVTGAPWLDVSEVRLVVNGERREPLPMKGADGKTVKFKDRVRIELERDGWVAVEVVGRASLYPVIQQRSRDGAAEDAALPYALTNPILIDVDGDGAVGPVWLGKVNIK